LGAGGKNATPTDFPGANLPARVRTAWAGLTARERLLATLAALLGQEPFARGQAGPGGPDAGRQVRAGKIGRRRVFAPCPQTPISR